MKPIDGTNGLRKPLQLIKRATIHEGNAIESNRNKFISFSSVLVYSWHFF